MGSRLVRRVRSLASIDCGYRQDFPGYYRSGAPGAPGAELRPQSGVKRTSQLHCGMSAYDAAGGMFRDLIVTKVFCAERFLFAAPLDWLHRYWQWAARPASAKRVQL